MKQAIVVLAWAVLFVACGSSGGGTGGAGGSGGGPGTGCFVNNSDSCYWVPNGNPPGFCDNIGQPGITGRYVTACPVSGFLGCCNLTATQFGYFICSYSPDNTARSAKATCTSVGGIWQSTLP